MFCSTPQISNRVQMMLKHGFETCIISLERVNIRSRFQFMFFLTSRYTLFQRTRDRVRNIIVSRNPRIFMLVITCCVLAIPEPRVALFSCRLSSVGEQRSPCQLSLLQIHGPTCWIQLSSVGLRRIVYNLQDGLQRPILVGAIVEREGNG